MLSAEQPFAREPLRFHAHYHRVVVEVQSAVCVVTVPRMVMTSERIEAKGSMMVRFHEELASRTPVGLL